MVRAPRSAPLLLFVLSLAACGRGEIEESQRTWLVEQHELDQRLLDVRREHDAQRRSFDPSPAAHFDAETRRRFDSVDLILRDHRAKLDRIDSTIERHSLAREVAIRADDEAAVAAAWEAARRDYSMASAMIDTIVTQQRSLPRAIAALGLPDTAAAGATAAPSDTASPQRPADTPSPARPDAIENTIGRDVPQEPE